ncbi:MULTISPECIES: Trk system potassium transporter TrkA [unclassified Lentilitoribacter]|jgi:trk system potassium uptake protein TrkA|uniref:Trk system potassium transporter TrkA n=1 Tax=unclassified Lentilitoribacter TaxID=2647570 RepID=UPI0013A69C68|nr:Trk system potassium transporter TrkA [Lentilitoribacter sp. Alg239-R112]
MKVIICGAGRVGYGIAERLAAEENDVSIIDTSEELIQVIRDTLDVRGYIGHGAHPEILARAGAEQADMIIAVTLSDEVNMVACQVAHSLFNVPKKIARIRAQGYLQQHWSDLFSSDHMPIDVIISPEIEVGKKVLRRIALPGAIDVVSFADDKVVMTAIECQENCPVVDRPLVQLTEMFPDLLATIVGVWRNGEFIVPNSSDQLEVGDVAYVVSSYNHVNRTLALFGHEEQEAQRIVIAGGGNIGEYVAKKIEESQSRTRVKIIEYNRNRALKVADNLDKTVVLNGSSIEQKILVEADIQDADLMIALTNDDQINILSCVMAKHLGCSANLALINSPTYQQFTKSIGIDADINPRSVTISRVLQHVRRGRIRSVYTLQKGAAEVIEAEALETSALVGKPIGELELPKGMRIGSVYRDGNVIKPNGATQIKAHDRVIILATADAVKAVEQLFRVSLEFF